MKCPHCQYEHKAAHYSDVAPYDYIESVGYYPFFQSVVLMEQPIEYSSAPRKALYACTECGKAFIEIG